MILQYFSYRKFLILMIYDVPTYFKLVQNTGRRLYFLLVTRYSLLVTRYSLFFTRYSLFFTRYSLFFTRYSLLVTRYFLLVTRYFLLVTRYSLFFTRYSLFFTRYSLIFTRYSLIFTRYSLFLYSLLPLCYFYLIERQKDKTLKTIIVIIVSFIQHNTRINTTHVSIQN